MDVSYCYKPLDPRANKLQLEKLACVCLSIENDPLYVHAQWVATFSDSANSSLVVLLSLMELV